MMMAFKFSRKKILWFSLSMLFLVSACSAYISKTKEQDEYETTVFRLVKDMVQNYHYHKLTIDDDFAKNALKSLLKSADNGKRFLLQKDVDEFMQFQLKLDDEFKNASLNTFELYYQIIEKREEWVSKMVMEILAQPLDLTSSRKIQINEDSLRYCENKEELKQRWVDFLTFSVIEKVYSLEQRNDSVAQNMTLVALEEKARADIKERYTDYFKRLAQLERNDRLSMYINALLAVYDPHTQYFPPKDKEDFDISFSGRLEGIGATLTVKDGYIKVNQIMPGSPSWKQGELEAGDLILEVAQGDLPPVDVYDMRLDKAVRLIRGAKGTEVRLTVKKADGQVKIIPIIRDIVVMEETYAKSLLLHDGLDENLYGYINLESFYADFQNRNGRQSARDLEKELRALKENGAKGLVLDLRNNGGGSLYEAIQMVGFFIDKGPVVQVQTVNQGPEVHEDKDPRVQFEYPLVVLVNKFSASASEIFAAAIQDYQRGVIVGVNTFGKGSVQRFYDLDDVANAFGGNKNEQSLGSIKQTIQKYYRIDGGATQLEGVKPDIILPEPYMYVEIGEKEYDFALPWTTIQKSEYKKIHPKYNINELIEHSTQRLATDSFFITMVEQAKFVKNVRDKSVYPLNYSEFKKFKVNLEEVRKRFEGYDVKMDDWEINFLTKDVHKMQGDTLQEERMKKFKKQIQKDHYVREALKILKEIE